MGLGLVLQLHISEMGPLRASPHILPRVFPACTWNELVEPDTSRKPGDHLVRARRCGGVSQPHCCHLWVGCGLQTTHHARHRPIRGADLCGFRKSFLLELNPAGQQADMEVEKTSK